MSQRMEIGGLTFDVRRSPKRKTFGLTVDRNGELVIHAPEAAQEQELSQWTRSKLLWVHRKLARKEEVTPKVREPEFVSGESFYYLGRSYRLTVARQQDEPLRFDGRRFYLRSDARKWAADHFRKWYVAVGTEWLAKRVGAFAPKVVSAAPSRVEVRDLGFRWGSCGRNGVIYFNWRLLQLPVRLADYVIAHELEHLIEPHHGTDFWHALDRSLPDWRARQEELRTKAQHVYWCHARMRQ